MDTTERSTPARVSVGEGRKWEADGSDMGRRKVVRGGGGVHRINVDRRGGQGLARRGEE